MTTDEAKEAEQRAQALAARASELSSSGRAQEAYRAVQEAVHLAPENARVKDIFSQLQRDDVENVVLKLCRKFAKGQDEAAGIEALNYLQTPQHLPLNVARECTTLMIKGTRFEKHANLQDAILECLLNKSPTAKAALAGRLQEKITTAPFESLYAIGDAAANGIATVVLSPEAWEKEAARVSCEKDVFSLYIAKLMEVGDDNNSRAIRGISRLLTAENSTLHELVDEDMFDAILSCLNFRNPIETRSLATLATAKIIQVAENRGHVMLTNFVATRYTRQTSEDLVLAFSAAAVAFSIATATAVAMFLTQDFLSSLIPLLEKQANAESVLLAALEMLNAACIDSACREGIRKYCLEWIQNISRSNQDQKSPTAVVILSKIQRISGDKGVESNSPQQKDENAEIVHRLTHMMYEDPKANRNSAFEGFAHASVQPQVKEKLVKDKQWLQVFLHELSKAESNSPAIFGGLVVIDNLTAYLPVLSEEQKQMAQLRGYANASLHSDHRDLLDEDKAVFERCRTMVLAGTTAVIIGLVKRFSPSCLALAFKIMLSLAQSTQALRGIMTQQGGVNMLVTCWDRVQGTPEQETVTRRNAAQALARLLISVDPSILFGPTGNALLQAAIMPLVSLLTENAAMALEGPRNLLPTFEALLALTNLASVPTNDASASIIRLGYASIEDLVLSSNPSVQRAATELTCNLVQDPAGAWKFAEPTPEAERRLHVFLALAGSHELGTRKGAAGALATLTSFEPIVDAINRQDRGMEMILAILDDEEDEVLHRGMYCLINVMNSIPLEGRDSGRVARARLRALGVKHSLDRILRRSHSMEVLEMVSQAVERLRFELEQPPQGGRD